MPIVLFPCGKQLPSESSGFLHPHDEKSNGIVFDDIRHSLSEIDQVIQLFMWVTTHFLSQLQGPSCTSVTL
jgi:hypothetical protein